MNILIIGCNGFIGNYAYRHFTENTNNTIVGCDIFNTYDKKNFTLLSTNEEAYTEIFSQKEFDYCINASGIANVAYSAQNPMTDYCANVFNTAKILEAIRKYNSNCKYINLSSAAVYGNPIELPINESTKTNPISVYGFHKLQSEMLCKEYSFLYGIQTINLRLFSVFGIGLKKQLFWDISLKITDTCPNLTLYGKPDDSRDYINISDLMQVFDLVIKNAVFDGSFINVANGIEYTIEEVVTDYLKLWNSNKLQSYLNQSLPGYPSRWVADISKLKTLGYIQKIDFIEGLRHYKQWLEELK